MAPRALCSPTVTRKDSTQLEEVTTNNPEQESVFLATTEMTAVTVIPELALAQQGNLIIPTLVETKNVFPR